jgi:hypothetical protein
LDKDGLRGPKLLKKFRRELGPRTNDKLLAVELRCETQAMKIREIHNGTPSILSSSHCG